MFVFRKNFLSWKRGIQVQYNLTRLIEWCKTNSVTEGILHLERLMQAAKLLQLPKNSAKDIETMFDVCFLLNPSQVKRLLSGYTISGYENPISAQVLQSVARRSVGTGEAEDVLLIDTRGIDNARVLEKLPTHDVHSIERYLPEWIPCHNLRQVVTLTL